MAGIAPDQAQQLLDAGAITPETYQMLSAQPAQPGESTPISLAAAPGAPTAPPIGPAPAPALASAEPAALPPVPASAQAEPDPRAIPGMEPAAAPGGAPSGIRLASDIRPKVQVDSMPGASLTGAYDLAEKGVALEAQAGAKQAAREAGYLAETAKQMQQSEDARKVAEAERHAMLRAQEEKLTKALTDLSGDKVDPNRYFKEMGTAQKVLTGISLFLGSFDPKGENAAAKMMNEAVNRDIEAQKANLNLKSDVMKGQQTLYGHMLQRFGDERQAEAASRLAILGNMEMQMKKTAAQYQGPKMEAQAMKGIAALEQEKQKAKLMFAQALEAQAAKRRLGGGGPGDSAAEDLAKLPKEVRELYVNVGGIKGFATSPERAKKLTEVAGEASEAKDLIRQLKEMDTEYLPFSENAARADTIRQALVGKLRTSILGPGTVNASERSLIEGLIADPTAIFQKNAGARLDQLEQIIDSSLKKQAASEGIRGGGGYKLRPAN
jgi:hypothetical protein